MTAWRKFGSVRSAERSLASAVVPELRDPSYAGPRVCGGREVNPAPHVVLPERRFKSRQRNKSPQAATLRLLGVFAVQGRESESERRSVVRFSRFSLSLSLAPAYTASMRTPSPTKIVCVGRNYAAHARELGNDIPERPLLFLKPPSALIAHGDAIVLPQESARVEHEAEIGIVIGRRTRHVSAAEALDSVAAYVPVNDVTARDLQKLDVQFTRAKGFDTFCPLGTPGGAEDWRALEVIGRVNGKVRQHGSARDMIFGIPEIIAYISRIMTLEIGDIIATGTPEGVGPLEPGDVVEVEIPGIGTLRNPVEAAGA